MAAIEIKERVHQLVDESDDQILRAVKAMLEAYQEEKWPDEEIADLNRDIEESEKEFEKGEIYAHEDAIKMSEEWQHRKK